MKTLEELITEELERLDTLTEEELQSEYDEMLTEEQIEELFSDVLEEDEGNTFFETSELINEREMDIPRMKNILNRSKDGDIFSPYGTSVAVRTRDDGVKEFTLKKDKKVVDTTTVVAKAAEFLVNTK